MASILAVGGVLAAWTSVDTARAADEEAGNAATVDSPPDSPVVQRAKATLEEFGSARSREDNVAIRTRLLALADTLETAGEDRWASECLERAGMVGYRLGEIDDALPIWKRGLEAARRSENPTRVAALLNANAVGVSASGDNGRALRLFEDLIEVRRSMDDARGEGIAWHNLAYSQLALYQFPEAMESLRHAMRLHEQAENTRGLAASRHALVQLLSAYGQHEEALAMADSALVAAERTGAPDLIGNTASNRAMLLHYAGRVEEALPAFDRAFTMLEQAGAQRLAASCSVNRADALVTAGRAAEAIAIIEPVLATTDELGDPSHGVIARSILGRALMEDGKREEARAVLEEAVAGFYAMQDTLDSAVSQADANVASEAIGYLALLHAREGRPADAWACLENSLGRTLRRELRPDGSVASLDEFQRKLEELNAMALVYGIPSVGGLAAVVVSASDVRAVGLRFPARLRGDIQSLMELMASGASDARCEPVQRRVADGLLTPVAPYLDRAARRLVLVPGGFAGLAFEVLPVNGESAATDDRSLGDLHSVVYAPSASIFLALEERAATGGDFLALADPAISHSEMERTSLAMRIRSVAAIPLPEARAEVADIAPANGLTLFGADATRRAFLDLGTRAAVVHFATHAVVDPHHPESSALLLATDGQEPAALSAEDIQTTPLAADLVSLSGCETAGGYQTLGEGTFGLARAFLLAGARSVVASWWDVKDAAARRFMELFYGGLAEGLDRDVAAQQARSTMEREGYPHRDRSAFVVMGAVSGTIPVVLDADRDGPSWRLWLVLLLLALAAAASPLMRRRGRAVPHKA